MAELHYYDESKKQWVISKTEDSIFKQVKEFEEKHKDFIKSYNEFLPKFEKFQRDYERFLDNFKQFKTFTK